MMTPRELQAAVAPRLKAAKAGALRHVSVSFRRNPDPKTNLLVPYLPTPGETFRYPTHEPEKSPHSSMFTRHSGRPKARRIALAASRLARKSA